jgi:hypothetical protein
MKPQKTHIRGERVETYRCTKDHAAGECEAAASIQAHLVEPVVVAELLARAEHLRFTAVQDDSALTVALADLADAEQQRRQVIEDGPEGLDHRDWRAMIAAARQREEAARERLAEAQERVAPSAYTASSAAEAWEDASLEDRQRLVRDLVDAVWVRRSSRGRHQPVAERVEVAWRGQLGDVWLPKRGGTPGQGPTPYVFLRDR